MRKLSDILSAVFLVLLSITTPVLAFDEDFFANNDIVWYNPDESQGFCPDGSLAVVLEGSTNEEKVWNFFVNADLPGVSDNPAAIAGIMGNIMAESSFNPFARGGSFHGLWQVSRDRATGMFSAMEAAELNQYWGNSNTPQEAQDQAIAIQLEALLEDGRWSGEGGNWYGSVGFMTNLGVIANRNSASSWSDLFLVSVLGAYNHGGSTSLTDSGVQSFANGNDWSRNVWQHADRRRNFAEEYYREFAANGTGAAYDGSSISTGDLCPGAGGSATIDGDLAFPVITTQAGFNRPTFGGPPGGHPYIANDIFPSGGQRSDLQIVAFMSGRVTWSSRGRGCGSEDALGVSVEGNRTVSYLHMTDGSATVRTGDQVEVGQPLGRIPTSGCRHLHIDMANGSRPPCSRADCPAANQARFVDLTPSLQMLWDQLPPN